MANEEILKPGFTEAIDATTKLKTNGKYTNLMLNDYHGTPGIQPGEFLTVQKHPEYAEVYTQEKTYTKDGRSWTTNQHSARVMVDDQEASFLLFSDAEAEAFNNAGGVDDMIQISKEKFTYVDKRGKEQIGTRLLFRGL